MSGDLPWLDVLTDPKAVQAKKNEYLKNVGNFLARCFNSQDYPGRYLVVSTTLVLPKS